ncbi:MAG: 50S ribosomal protein L25/general stress protein Ctc [Leptolyngbyaceae cyanobacterium SM1_4_3]|nr:50S ribosomal protein L25/general stress protein Ctc [Leptolyngbyaceae cyanobacterium SM1_4_3]NJO67206.1 50S ribosomal protein L25/general stress protein Ctc [Leptolyngbyaceae cyanobacterium RM1_405_57]
MELTVECQKRAPGSKAGVLRREGRMPAVLYGHKGAESISLTLDAKDAETLVRKASINNTLIQVKVPDIPWSGKALLREVQTHPWRRSIYHISFFSIAAQSSVEVTVPINFVGEAVGVKMGGGALDTVLTELQVQCDPEAIPETIEVDVSDFQIGDSVHVNELKLPKGVVAVGEPDRVVVSVLAGRGPSGDDGADESASASE